MRPVQDINAVLAQLDRELWVVTAADGKQRGGLIATFVSQASIVPEMPRVLVGIAKQHHTRKLIDASGVFALHLLEETKLEWVWRFGLQSGHGVDKLAGLAWQLGATASPLLSEALAWLECRVEARFDTGDRTVYLAEVVAGKKISAAKPLTFRHLLQLAPPERLAQMKALLVRDAHADALVIERWREGAKDR
jgi:flavin reductase (DIM6/NTAB) family NADH-FMN oxidoreductase RutF